VLLDCSGSMKYKGANDALSKFRYGQFVAACLTYLILHQQDAAGLITFDNKVRELIPTRGAPSHLMTIVQALDGMEAKEESAIAPILHEIAERIPRRGMVILISDLFDNAEALMEALHHLRHKRHEVILLQVMAEDELTFPFRKFSLFESLERADDKQKLDPAVMRTQYLRNVAAHLKAIREGAGKLGISHELMNTSEPFDKTLTGYLARRMGSR